MRADIRGAGAGVGGGGAGVGTVRELVRDVKRGLM